MFYIDIGLGSTVNYLNYLVASMTSVSNLQGIY